MNKKSLIVGLIVFAAILAGVYVAYTLRKPTLTPSPVPAPKVQTTPTPSPAIPEVNEVAAPKCQVSFTITDTTQPGLNCLSKELYKNVTANTPGTYDLAAGNKLAADFKMVKGEMYIYVIKYSNTGTAATDGTIEDVLPAGISFKDAESGCTYDNATRKVTCTLSSVAAGAAGQRAIRFTVDADTDKETITNNAKVIPTTGAQTTCSLTTPIKTPTPSTSTSPSPSSSSTASSSPGSAQLTCVVKRVYEDNGNNKAGQYYLNNEIVDTTTLTDGQTVVYNVVAGNTGSVAVSDTTITDVLSSNLTYVDGDNGCSYNSSNRTVTCTIGSIAANTQASRSFRAKITTASTSAIANTATVSSTNGQRDTCSITINAQGKVVAPASVAPSALPEAGIFEVTAGTLGLGVLLLVAGTLGLLLL